MTKKPQSELPQPLISEERLRALPRLPGVYLMKNSAEKILYVGKAKNLRARVRSYFNFSDTRYKVRFLVEQVANIETVVTVDEREALILENDLIKQHLPRYNARLKDDKSNLIVRISQDHPYPRLELVRRMQNDGARYLGPFAFTHELRTLLELIQRTVPLRSCSDKVMANRVRPCLEYQIKRCAGPCCLAVTTEEYRSWIATAVDILEGRAEEVIIRLRAEMERASEELRYEDAAVTRDRLAVLERLGDEKPSVNYGPTAKDIFGLYREGSSAELAVLSVRFGRLAGGRTFGLSDLEIPDSELLQSLLTQYYSDGTALPDEILLPCSIEDRSTRELLYSDERNARVRIVVPRRGDKLRLIRLAEENAKQNFSARFGKGDRADVAISALRDELQLAELPRTIECVDVSHFQGGETVAAVVFFRDGRPDRSRYRLFRLTQEGKPDDFASMREVVMRHLSRSREENTLPDLLVVDGGPAQLSQAVMQRKELSLDRPLMIGLAKRRALRTPYLARSGALRHKPERVYLENENVPVVLKPTSEALHLLERVRDEAHRFAVSFHRRRRTQKLFSSELEKIPGIGANRRKMLLREFGSVAEIRKAAPEEIARRCNFPESLARRVIELLTRSDE